MFYPYSVAVARYAALIRIKFPTNWDSQLTKSLFQTRSSTAFYIQKRTCILAINIIKIHVLFLYAIPGSTNRLSPSAAEVAR
ncbi:MAG: DUF6783 domain-containing protein [Lachnospiraceae bacterium]